MTTIKNKLELVMQELDGYRKEIESLPAAAFGELDKRLLLRLLKDNANRIDEVWHQLG